MIALRTQRVQALQARPSEQRWLIEELWADQAVGIVGGEPKCAKSFLALQIAVAVASGTPCLGRFAVKRTGRVLVFAAEDPPHLVRERVEGICRLAGADFQTLDLHLITRDVLRIDLPDDLRALEITIAELRPTLLILDPFVRLHRVDENASGEVAPLLAALRVMQRTHALAILVVHHARKGAGRMRAGQALRGSSEFHAWGDSNLYLRREPNRHTLTVEHRASASIGDLELRLGEQLDGSGLLIDEPAARTEQEPAPDIEQRIVGEIERCSPTPIAHAELRKRVKLRNQVLCERLAQLVREGTLVKTPGGYRLPTQQHSEVPVPVPQAP